MKTEHKRAFYGSFTKVVVQHYLSCDEIFKFKQQWFKVRALHASLLNIAPRHSYFSKNFPISAEKRY